MNRIDDPDIAAKTDTALGDRAALPSSRRSLLRRGMALGIAVPFAVPAPRAYGSQQAAEDDRGHGDASTPVAGGIGSDSHATEEEREEDEHEKAAEEHNEAPIPSLPARAFTPYDPLLRPVEPGPKDFTVVARDVTLFVAKDMPYAAWTYDGTIPGRTLRVVEGDTITVTFHVDPAANAHHSLDFHSAKTPPDKNFRTIDPGQELSWSFVAKHAGAYMYHCGTPRVLMHIGAGLYGAMIVDPKAGWSPARELILVQSDFYLTDGAGGVKVPDYTRMLGGGAMDLVVFNGYANQYVEHPIPVRVGEQIRIFVVNAGPNVWSSFHVVGTVFDRVCVNANPRNELFGLQSITIGPGDGACVEFVLDEPGTYPIVNHAFGHAAHGAVGLLRAE